MAPARLVLSALVGRGSGRPFDRGGGRVVQYALRDGRRRAEDEHVTGGLGDVALRVGRGRLDVHVGASDPRYAPAHLLGLAVGGDGAPLRVPLAVGHRVRLTVEGEVEALSELILVPDGSAASCGEADAIRVWVEPGSTTGTAEAIGVAPGRYAVRGSSLGDPGVVTPDVIEVTGDGEHALHWTPPAGWRERYDALLSSGCFEF